MVRGKFQVNESDNIKMTIRGVEGVITGEAIYGEGHPGSYWIPPEPSELEDIIMYHNGVLISDDDLCDEDIYISLQDAVWPVIHREFYSKFEEECADTFGQVCKEDLPF